MEDGIQEMGDRRCETGDKKQVTGIRSHEMDDGIQETSDRRQDLGDTSMETGEGTGDRRCET